MRRLLPFGLALLLLLAPFAGLGHAVAQSPARDWDVPGGHFFTQTGGGQNSGFAVADGNDGAFWSEFRRLGGVESLGYPISRTFAAQGFTYQLFQRGALQWRPESGQAVLANIMDWLSDAGQEPLLASMGIPSPLADGGGTWQQAVAERESWLSEPAIAQVYRQGGGYNRYGLPASRPERVGPFLVQRFQRYAFQLWLEDVPGMPVKGSVVGVLVGDLARQAGLVPAPAAVPETSAGLAVRDAAGCQSNPASAIKSADVDIVRYRFFALAFDKVAAEVIVRNNCPEPRRIRLGARVSPAPGALPVVLGGELEADFAPGEEKTLLYDWTRPDGTYPAIDPNHSLSFRWNWQRQGSTEMACLPVGAERCLQVDPWLRTTVRELAGVPVGADLLRRAAGHGVPVIRADLPDGELGSYGLGLVRLSDELDDYSEFERAEVLAHELRHAVEDAKTPLPESGQGCLDAEVRAFQTSAEAWYALWGGNLPQPQNALQARFNQLAATAHDSPAALQSYVASAYATQCR